MEKNNQATTAKILVCYHKPTPLIKNEVFVPIHVGRGQGDFGKDGQRNEADALWLQENMIGDDTGENISAEGTKWSELTAQYWAWKNYDKLGNPDYIGLMHYRRLLVFHPEEEEPENQQKVRVDYFTDEVIEKYASPEYVLRGIEDYDIYLYIQPKNIHPGETEGEHRRRAYGTEVDLSLETVKRLYPDVYADAEAYFAQPSGARCNMMVCRREIFFEYCEFLFKVLAEIEETLDLSFYSAYDFRMMGIISEWLLGMWAFSKARRKGYKVKGLPTLMPRDWNSFNRERAIPPAFAERSVAMCCACDEAYAYPCGVMLRSVIEHASPEFNYDIVVLNNGLTPRSKEMLKSLLPPPAANFSLRFYDMKEHTGNRHFRRRGHKSATTYCKLFVPGIFSRYSKVVYLDCDTLALEDIRKLYDTDVSKHWLAAARDLQTMIPLARKWRASTLEERPQAKKRALQYFNAGVLVYNIRLLKEAGAEEKWLESALEGEHKQLDQDVLNLHCKGHVKYLDTAWNVVHEASVRENAMWRLPAEYYKKWLTQDRLAPKIIHYSHAVKPWDDAGTDLASYWWCYARQLPFYEAILQKQQEHAARRGVENALRYYGLIDEQAGSRRPQESLHQLLRGLINCHRLGRKLWLYRLGSHLTFGSLRERCVRKKRMLRNTLKRLRRFAQQSN